MVEQGAAGVDDQNIAQLFGKDLVGVSDHQDIVGKMLESPAPVCRLGFVQGALLVEQPDAVQQRIGRAGMNHEEGFPGKSHLFSIVKTAQIAFDRAVELVLVLRTTQVPEVMVADDGVSIKTADLKWVINPYDEYAVEEALRIREAQGGTVTITTRIYAAAFDAKQCLETIARLPVPSLGETQH